MNKPCWKVKRIQLTPKDVASATENEFIIEDDWEPFGLDGWDDPNSGIKGYGLPVIWVRKKSITTIEHSKKGGQ
jgi:hypothetical protein